MSRPNHGGPKLPSALLETVGSSEIHSTSKLRGSAKSKPLTRKDQRKAFRVEKKQAKSQPRRALLVKQNVIKRTMSGASTEPKTLPLSSANKMRPDEKEGTSISKPKPLKSSKDKKSKTEHVEKPSISRAIKAKLDEDDAEIAALEKKLGITRKSKKTKPAGDEDFDSLLDGIDADDETLSGKRKRSDYGEFLASKRRQVEGPYDSEESDGEQSNYLDHSELASEGISDDSSDGVGLISDEGSDEEQKHVEYVDDEVFGGLDDSDQSDSERSVSQDVTLATGSIESEDESAEELNVEESEKERAKLRENPYVAPVDTRVTSSAKYIPPSKRKPAFHSDTEDLSGLRRQLKGLLNRLSESNLLSIVRDVETIYSSNARQHVTTILIDLLMGQLCDRSALMDTFIILHASFAAAIYKTIGAHFGAQLLERVVADFSERYEVEAAEASGTKEVTNLIALLAELYTFQVVGANVIFDYIRMFLADLTEINTELLLKIIKNCGSQLRHDDPSSLKDIVVLLHKSVTKTGEANLPVRTKFMIEIINDLKNNKLKAGAAASIVASEQTSRLKRTLGSFNTQVKTSEPLGVSLADIKRSGKDGKWWLVGASWKNEVQGADTVGNDTDEAAPNHEYKKSMEEGFSDLNLIDLARQQRMNTDIRRAIFVNIMSAEDFKDAHMRLLKLRLKKAQELEIPRVLIHCAGAEDSYNPYYTLIAKQLCTEHRFRWAMQYGLWDLFKRMGEKNETPDESDDEDENLDDDTAIDLKKVVNLGRMYGHLVADRSMSLTSLKVLNFPYLQPKTKAFLEVMLSTTFKLLSKRSKPAGGDTGSFNSMLTALLTPLKDAPQLITGLQYFLSKEADLQAVSSSSSERKLLRKASSTAILILTQLSTSLS